MTINCETIFVNIPATGKTTLALAIYYIYRFGLDPRFEIIDIGPPEIDMFFADAIDKLREGKVPDATPFKKKYEMIKFSLYDNKTNKNFTLTFYSMSGELVEIIGKDRSEEVIRALIRQNPIVKEYVDKLLKSDLIVLTFDPTKRNSSVAIDQSKCLANTLLSVYAATVKGISLPFKRKKKKSKKPIAVVITKSDRVPEAFDDPQGFFRGRAPLVFGVLNNRFERVMYLAVSAFGESIEIGNNQFIPKDGEMKPINVDKLIRMIVDFCLSG